jgi:hypothetical protein
MVATSPQRLTASLAGVLFALLAAAALLQSTVLVMFDPGLLGWQPGHGHVFPGGRAHVHSHPSDAPSTAGIEGGSAVIFTPANEALAGSVAGSLAVPVVSTIAPAVQGLAILAAADPVVPPDAPADVPAPPPRG